MTSKAGGDGEKANDQEPPFFRIVEGVKIPTAFEGGCKRPMQEHVQLLKAMEMRPDDVMLVAFMKSGTHWIWEVISMLLSGNAEYEKRAKEFAMMEATQIEKMDSQPSPRVFNTHLPFHILPRQIKEKKVKVAHVYRNAKDVLVSAYFHLCQTPLGKTVTLEDVEQMMMAPEAKGFSYWEYLKEMDEFRKDNPDVPFFAMSFEDMKEDPGKAVKNLAEFLGLEASPQLCADIVQATSFSNMKEADKTKQDAGIGGLKIQMYRKGEVGDWKNYLTVAQSERIDAAMSCLKSCDYHFRFTL